ncbi:M56 family metallopeptidase [Pseudoteredinibacter isoporae]|uniref:Peptidase M56 domain-containing protein n=1 Tax=Pseudoteredinibacter isoporae TaxID=570281 RepID=A0A7X0JPN9_9GAMM|nr:M56 family metallopeptidase [Pseudoteredinibacter isoporae]MBB6519980.1 hypothetical protein [Pseudoteredinibacter isoporae]NHO85552.1 M56 family metallopeptidase [Pseudoteredinibacter isoporae]NIB25996.1 M56 family metallopeptidase [Pseudoteredinibacter isoporae]
MVTTLLSIAHLLGVFFLALIAAALLFNTLASLMLIPRLKKHFQSCKAQARLQSLTALSLAPLLAASLSLVAVGLLAAFPQYADDYFHWHHVPEQFNWHSVSGIVGLIAAVSFVLVKAHQWKQAQQQFRRWQGNPNQVQQATAFSYGTSEENIFISPTLAKQLNEKELNIVVAHEQAHCHYRDPIKLYLVRCLYTLFFYPLRKTLSRQYYLAMEERADVQTVRSGFNRFDIAGTLVKVARLQNQTQDFKAACSFSSSFIPERVDALSGEQKDSSGSPTVMVALILTLVLSLVFSIDSVHHLSEAILFYFL